MTSVAGLAPPMISVHQLSHQYSDGTLALDGVDLSVDRGEAVVLLGSNGSGKSTLLKALTRLLEPTSGNITVDGVDVTTAGTRELRDLRRRVGMVFQSINLVDQVSVLSNVIHGGLGRSSSPRNWFAWTAPQDSRELAMGCLHRVGLEQFASRRADQLSGGQRQRVAIARLLMQEPTVVVADEPVAALDPRAGREVMDLLWSIVAEEKLTLVCSLHQLELAESYGDRVVALKNGRLTLDDRIGALSRGELSALYTGVQT